MAQGSEPRFAVFFPRILTFDDRVFKNQGCQPEIDAAFGEVGLPLVLVLFKALGHNIWYSIVYTSAKCGCAF